MSKQKETNPAKVMAALRWKDVPTEERRDAGRKAAAARWKNHKKKAKKGSK
jgi:hypothetical protein